MARAASTLALGPTQPHIQWVPVGCPGRKQPRREADHSSPYSGEVTDAWRYSYAVICIFMAWCLNEHGGNFSVHRYFVRFLFHVTGCCCSYYYDYFCSFSSSSSSYYYYCCDHGKGDEMGKSDEGV